MHVLVYIDRITSATLHLERLSYTLICDNYDFPGELNFRMKSICKTGNY